MSLYPIVKRYFSLSQSSGQTDWPSEQYLCMATTQFCFNVGLSIISACIHFLSKINGLKETPFWLKKEGKNYYNSCERSAWSYELQKEKRKKTCTKRSQTGHRLVKCEHNNWVMEVSKKPNTPFLANAPKQGTSYVCSETVRADIL